jgi:hypothetical protein
LQGNEYWNQGAARLQASKRFADDGPKCARWIVCSHGVSRRGRRGEHVADFNRREVRIDLAPDLSRQSQRTAIGVGLTVKNDARAVVSRTGYDPTNAVVVRFVADADLIVTHQHDDAAWFGNWSNHSELFSKVCPRQLNVAVNTEILGDMHMAPKHTGETTTGVDGPYGRWPTLTLGINTY